VIDAVTGDRIEQIAMSIKEEENESAAKKLIYKLTCKRTQF